MNSKATVIIPTYNGRHKIMNLLNSLCGQAVMPAEVLVVIDGSTDGTGGMLRSQSFPFPSFRIVEQDNGGRAKVRNRGAQEAAGDLLIFIDDDMTVPAEWVQQHIAHHTAHPGSIATGRLKDPYAQNGTDFQRFKSWLNDKWNRNVPNATHEDASLLTYPYVTAGNMSVNKETFGQLNGFDNRLTDAEDYDLAKRAMQLNIPLYFNHVAYAWHNDEVNCVKYVQRLRQYTVAQQKLAALKPELYGSANQYEVKPPAGAKGSLFAALCKKWWIDSVDKGTWKWLPAGVRYKLYDMIVTANGSFFPGKVTL